VRTTLFDCLEPPPPPGSHLRRSDWEVGACSLDEALEFVTETHYAAGASKTAVYRHALRRKGGLSIYGVALWIPPTRDAALTVDPNWRGVLALSRLCVAPDMPTNSASFLLGGSMRLIDRRVWPTLITYADTRHGHTGAIYRATNWTCLGEVPAADSWRHRVTGEQRGRKRGNRTMTRTEMLAAGFDPLPPAPKVKFVHRRAP
jgi:hypothetical protein